MEQKHSVLTVDVALFPKLMALKWTRLEFEDTLIPSLGCLHTAMNFLKALGQHTKDSGLFEVWTESGILGPNTADKAMAGKSYAKGMCAHKLTLQALWQLLLPQLLHYLEERDQGQKDYIAGTMEKALKT